MGNLLMDFNHESGRATKTIQQQNDIGVVRAPKGEQNSSVDKGIPRDTLKISPPRRGRWVVCPLRRTRGHGRLDIYPRRVREYRKEESM